jgi:hypothetical protein
MFNLKWGLVPGAIAFILALVTSLFVGNTDFTTALIRALLFTVLFFAMGNGAWILINKFLPELLPAGHDDDPVGKLFSAEPSASEPSAGSRINITLDDTAGGDMSDSDAVFGDTRQMERPTGESRSYGTQVAASNAAIPGKNGEEHDINAVENVDDLVSGKKRITPGTKKARDIDQNPASGYTEAIGELVPDSPANDTNEDFSFGFDNYIPGSTGIEELDTFTDPFSIGESSQAADRARAERRDSANKPTAFEGDFNPKEIAAGLRTVLEQDKKG